MELNIETHLPWVLSFITIWMSVLAGNKSPMAWSLGFVGQALWLVWILKTQTWGLVPLNAALWVIYVRNHIKWINEGQEKIETTGKQYE